MPRVAIIGAGISGLVCAKRLIATCDVTLFEKSRGVAGRMATRRVPDHGLAFDHEAQYFTVRSERVQPLLEEWIYDGIIAPWRGNVAALRPGQRPDRSNSPRYVAVPNMNALGKHLAIHLDVKTEVRISRAFRSNGVWSLRCEDDNRHEGFDLLIVTTPPKQASDLLGDESPFQGDLAQVEVAPCWATLVYFDEKVAVPYDGAFVHENPLSWICRNNSKPGRAPDKECWVLHGTSHWSRENLELTPEEITPRMLKAMQDAIGQDLPKVNYATSHRWRFSLPETPLPQRYLWNADEKLGLCGDWCAGPRVEGAIESGLSLAAKVRESFSK